MMKVSSLYQYPIKSCAGTSIEEGRIDRRGFLIDRRWMIVDAADTFVTQREIHKLCLIQPRVQLVDNQEVLWLRAPNMPDLEVPTTREFGERLVRVWRDQCRADDQGDAAADWLSAFLGIPVRLVKIAPDFKRQVDQNFALREDDEVGFADGFPFLLISQESLDDLNGRLEQTLPMDRFRPNIVVSGCSAFAEDEWKTIRIGDVMFDVVKPCARCVITTVEQTTGIAGSEPLRTFAKYRNVGGRLLFGQNVVHHTPGTIRIDDPVSIL